MMQTDTTLTRSALITRYGPAFNPPLVQVDKAQRPSTRGIWDFSTPWGAPGGYTPLTTVPAGTQTRNSVETGAAASLPVAVAYSGGAIVFTTFPSGGAFNQQAQFGSVTLKTGLALSAWVKSNGTGIDGGNNTLMGIVGLFDVVLAADANRKVTALTITGPGVPTGVLCTSADLNSALNDNRWHKIRLHMEARPGGKHRYAITLDAIEVFVTPDYTTGTLSGTGLVFVGAGTALFTIDGKLARVVLEDIPPGAAQALDDLEYDSVITPIGNQ